MSENYWRYWKNIFGWGIILVVILFVGVMFYSISSSVEDTRSSLRKEQEKAPLEIQGVVTGKVFSSGDVTMTPIFFSPTNMMIVPSVESDDYYIFVNGERFKLSEEAYYDISEGKRIKIYVKQNYVKAYEILPDV